MKLEKLNLFVASGFGLGLVAPFAPGTFGSLPGVALAYALAFLPPWAQIPLCLLLTLAAIPICDLAERTLGIKDDGRITADEWMLYPISFVGIPILDLPWWSMLVFFAVVRAIDIIKPPPARQLQSIPGGRGKKATEYFRINPHRLNFGNVALVIKDGKGQIKEADLKDIDQRLDLYNGMITSRFSALGQQVIVQTACMPCEDAMVYSINSRLLSSGKASVRLSLPYPSGKHADAATDWENEDKHVSRIIKSTGKSALVIIRPDKNLFNSEERVTYYEKDDYQ